jgi:hypothetical protein
MRNSGEQYVLDLSGAQYGWYEPVTTWEAFVTSRVRSFVHPGIQSFGTYRKEFLAMSNGSDFHGSVAKINGHISPEIKRLTQSWEKEQNLMLEKVLRMDDEALEGVRRGLLNHIKLGLQDSLRALGESDPGSRSQIEALYMKSIMGQL